MPHGTASPKVVEAGDFVTFDFGAVWEGYHSDITRTVVVGKASQAQKDFYNLILEGQKLGVSLIKAGVSRREVDFAVRTFRPLSRQPVFHSFPGPRYGAWRSTNNQSCRRVRQAYSKRI